MTKVLFIIWSLEKGGAERFLAGLLENIDQKKFDPVLCCLNWKGEWAQAVENRGIPVIALHKKSGLDFGAFMKLVKILKTGQYKIVNTHLWAADVMGRVAALFCRVPIVVSTAQNVDVWKRWWHRGIDRILSFGTDRIIAVSGAVKEYYNKSVGIPQKKIDVICNAIDVRKYENISNSTYIREEFGLAKEDFVLACIGRLTHQKGHKYLFESLHVLRGDHPNLKVLIVGDGEYHERLTKLAKDLNIESMVRFTGQRSDIAQILDASQAMVLPSVFEGLPLCMLEAMAAAKPVIATDVGGVSELGIDQETSFIIPSKDVGALTEAIKNLISLPDQGKQMGLNGRKVVKEKFSIQAITQQTENLFFALSEEQS